VHRYQYFITTKQRVILASHTFAEGIDDLLSEVFEHVEIVHSEAVEL
jgi:hypothetical protein